MARVIDLNTWKRKVHFDFFKDCDNPFFGITANVDVTQLHKQTKEKGYSYFLAVLYLSLKAANEIEEFRYRIRGEQVVVLDEVHAGSTILADDETFRFCYFPMTESFEAFHKAGKMSIEETKQTEGLELRDDSALHYSSIPWVSFTAFNHARRYNNDDCVPKIVFGKYFEENGKVKMPLSVEVHHSLADGLHVGKFFERFQQLLNEGV
ncbi:chloramphenicol acetyltransferase [Limibacter armeniacum]|uniref:chloramphenicol acetyltransferase n=1 Tax=Limibacter armeniacum TaxID=466084 RepID=UPI002FE6A147